MPAGLSSEPTSVLRRCAFDSGISRLTPTHLHKEKPRLPEPFEEPRLGAFNRPPVVSDIIRRRASIWQIHLGY